MIPTKKEDTEKVAFSRKFINDEITKLNTEITTLEEKLVAFNAGEINNAA
jgi:hypothetical protein